MEPVAVIANGDAKQAFAIARDIERVVSSPLLVQMLEKWLPQADHHPVVVVAVPARDQLAACRLIRRHFRRELFVLVEKNSGCREEALIQSGASEVITLPLNPDFGSRLRTAIARSEMKYQVRLRRSQDHGFLHLDEIHKDFHSRGRYLHLKGPEYEVLRYLYLNHHRICDVEELCIAGWRVADGATRHAIHQCLSRLTKKFKSAGLERPFENIRGLGYQYFEPTQETPFDSLALAPAEREAELLA